MINAVLHSHPEVVHRHPAENYFWADEEEEGCASAMGAIEDADVKRDVERFIDNISDFFEDAQEADFAHVRA